MTVSIQEIEEILLHLLLKYRENRGENVEINNDFYWDVFVDGRCNSSEIPKNLGLGQVSFDLQILQDLRTKNYEYALPYHLERIASVLIALSAKDTENFNYV